MRQICNSGVILWAFQFRDFCSQRGDPLKTEKVYFPIEKCKNSEKTFSSQIDSKELKQTWFDVIRCFYTFAGLYWEFEIFDFLGVWAHLNLWTHFGQKRVFLKVFVWDNWMVFLGLFLALNSNFSIQKIFRQKKVDFL